MTDNGNRPTDTDDGLSPQERRFAELYFAGPSNFLGNGVRSALAAFFPDADPFSFKEGDPEYNASGKRAWGLRRSERVRAYVEEMRAEATEDAKRRMRDWWELAPDAQLTILAAARGDLASIVGKDGTDEDKRQAVQAAVHLLDRAMGSVKQMFEHRVTGQAIIAHIAGPRAGRIEPADEEDEEEAIEAVEVGLLSGGT